MDQLPSTFTPHLHHATASINAQICFFLPIILHPVNFTLHWLYREPFCKVLRGAVPLHWAITLMLLGIGDLLAVLPMATLATLVYQNVHIKIHFWEHLIFYKGSRA